jgi:hypothetical protein
LVDASQQTRREHVLDVLIGSHSISSSSHWFPLLPIGFFSFVSFYTHRALQRAIYPDLLAFSSLPTSLPILWTSFSFFRDPISQFPYSFTNDPSTIASNTIKFHVRCTSKATAYLQQTGPTSHLFSCFDQCPIHRQVSIRIDIQHLLHTRRLPANIHREQQTPS